MRLSLLGALLASFASSVLAVYADEAYEVDYHQAYLGLPQQHTTFFHRPTSTSRASLLYTLSEKLILGAINPKDGAVVWRQSVRPKLSNATNAYLRAGVGADVVISAAGGEVRAWDASDGKLVWERDFLEGEARDLEVVEPVESTAGKSSKDVLALFASERGGILRRLSGASGETLWESEQQSGDIPIYVSSSASAVFSISLQPAGKNSFRTRVTNLDPVTGKQASTYTLSSESDVAGAASVLKAGANSASPLLAWTDKASKTVKINLLGSKHISSFNIANDSGDEITRFTVHSPDHAQSLNHFLVHFGTDKSHWAEVYHVDVAKGSISHAYSLPRVAGAGAFSTSTQDANVYFTRHTESEVILVSSASHGILQRWPRTDSAVSAFKFVAGDADAVHAVSEVVARSGATFSVRSALALVSGDWVLVRNGGYDWRRTEALSGVIAAEWVELKDSEDLAKELEVEGHGNVLSAYVHRVRRHAKDLERSPAWVQGLPARILTSITGGDKGAPQTAILGKDNFGFRKLVVVATDSGRLYALDTGNRGKVVWIAKVAELGPGEKWQVRGILADSSAGTVTVMGAAGDSSTVDSATGKLLHSQPTRSVESVEYAVLIDNDSGTQDLLEVDASGNPGELPSDSLPKGDQVLVVRSNEGTLQGMKYVRSQASTTQPTVVWEFSPPPGSSLSGFTGRSSDESVASIGRVLGDRSVMYKYLNPNLLLATSINRSKSTASFHVLDGVSGNTLYSVTHGGVDTSRHISSVVSENWLVYSFWGELEGRAPGSSSTRGFQLVAAEIYESELPNDRGPLGDSTSFSAVEASGSDSAPLLPYVVSQTFLVNQEISGLAVTRTRQGITSRSLLATLASSNAIVAIPRGVLDPRRPVGRDATAAEAEEGLWKYAPVIEFDPKWFLTHKQEVIGVKNVITSPALLESTSLVFAYGLDIFGTRVAPSMAFDFLGKGFAKIQLILTVVGLGVGVMLVAPTVRRKQINSRWQVS